MQSSLFLPTLPCPSFKKTIFRWHYLDEIHSTENFAVIKTNVRNQNIMHRKTDCRGKLHILGKLSGFTGAFKRPGCLRVNPKASGHIAPALLAFSGTQEASAWHGGPHLGGLNSLFRFYIYANT